MPYLITLLATVYVVGRLGAAIMYCVMPHETYSSVNKKRKRK